MISDTAIFWFRRDFRLTDNPALNAAIKNHRYVLPVYIHAPEEEAPWEPGTASQWWQLNSLRQLEKQLKQLGSFLIIRQGSSLKQLQDIIRVSKAKVVYFNFLNEPELRKRDRHLSSTLLKQGVEMNGFNGNLLHDPDAIKTAEEMPYRVFGAYWKKTEPHVYSQAAPLPAPKNIPTPKSWLNENNDDFYKTGSTQNRLADYWSPGEQSAHKQLIKFCNTGLENYQTNRDFPALTGTSSMSPFLHFGELSPRQVLSAVLNHQENPAAQNSTKLFLTQLGWREFANYLLFHFPKTTTASMDSRFDETGWINTSDNIDSLQRWQQGKTGIPIVDAGMHELAETGFMHNRVRMIVASLLCKNLGFHWLEGARWFWEKLVDADLANNTMGWQWTAGCGVDAAPYFRIFNPLTQAKRFDPDGLYVRKWLPQLADRELRLFDTENYPQSMIDLANSRQQALSRWDAIKSISRS